MAFRRGIILTTQLHNAMSISILDRSAGIIYARCAPAQIIAGAHITYLVNANKRTHMLECVNIEKLPRVNSPADILYVHHILELCRFWLRDQVIAHDIFDYMHSTLYDNELPNTSYLYRLLSCAQLMLKLGIYPEPIQLTMSYLRMIGIQPIDQAVQTTVQLNNTQRLRQWLQACWREHPSFTTMNTTDFLNGQINEEI